MAGVSGRSERRRARIPSAILVAITAIVLGWIADPALSSHTCFGVSGQHLTTNDDTFPGTSGVDTVSGLGGNDTLLGIGGDDRLCGDFGSDDIEGGR